MAGSHVVVARYDMLALDLLESGCIFVGDASRREPSAIVDAELDAGPAATPSAVRRARSRAPSAAPSRTSRSRRGTARSGSTSCSSAPTSGRSEGTYNTDTLIVVSIDPETKQVAMFSLPRDTVDVPVPPGPARQAFGPVYTKKINAWFTSVRNRADLFPGTDRTRGYNGLKAILGNLYGLDIKYFVEVNFEGFKKVVDALGGVTINVQIPVVDDRYPGDGGSLERIYIPSGIQHMNGAQALRYARSRHTSTDFDRGAAPAARPPVARASRPTRRTSSRGCRSWSPRSRRRSGPTSRSTSSTSCSASRPRSTPRTSARTSSRRRSTGRRS